MLRKFRVLVALCAACGLAVVAPGQSFTIKCGAGGADEYEVTIKTSFYEGGGKAIPKVQVGAGQPDPERMRIEVTVEPKQARAAERKLLVCPMVNCAYGQALAPRHQHTKLEDSKMTAPCEKCPPGSGINCGGAGHFQRKFDGRQDQKPSYRFECIEFTFPAGSTAKETSYAKGDGITADATNHQEWMTSSGGAGGRTGIVGCRDNAHGKTHRQKAAEEMRWYIDFLCNQHTHNYKISCFTEEDPANPGNAKACCKDPSGSGHEHPQAPVGNRVWWIPAEPPWSYTDDDGGRFVWRDRSYLVDAGALQQHLLWPHNANTMAPDALAIKAYYEVDPAGVPAGWEYWTDPPEGELFLIDPSEFREDLLFVQAPETIPEDTVATFIVRVRDVEGRELVTHYIPKAYDVGPPAVAVSCAADPNGQLTFSAVASDTGAGVKSVTLAYEIDGGPTEYASFNLVSGDYRNPTQFSTTLGPLPPGSVFIYRAEASDEVGNSSQTGDQSCTVPGIPLECGLQASGAPRDMLIIGPIQTESQSPTDPACDDAGRFSTTDYLVDADGDNGEESILVQEGDELAPDFRGLAGGTGVVTPTVNPAVNPAINPDGDLGILQVWRADADAQGRINFNDGDNIGDPVDYYVVYGLVYIENTTGECLPVTFEVGTDDSPKLRLNGQLLPLRPSCRPLPGYGAGDYASATLVPGVNVVLVGVVQRQGGTDLRLVIRDAERRPLRDGRVRTTCDPPASYPAPLPPAVTRAIDRTAYHPGDTITVTLDATGVTAPTVIDEAFSRNLTPGDPGDGEFDGSTFRATISNDQQLTYTLVVPEGGCAEATSDFSGTASPEGGCAVAIGGLASLRCDPVCPLPPDAEPVELVAAFYFGSRDLEAVFGPVSLESDPDEVYTGVLQVDGDPLSIAYPDPEVELAPGVFYPDEDRTWGYQIFYNDPSGLIASDSDLPAPIHSLRGGWEIYGPMDDSVNDRNEFPDALPEEIYDSFSGAKNWLAGQESCSELTVGNRMDPCSTIQDPDGTIFRVDVPNGLYRFVLAVGDADNHHAHRILAEDGGEGPPQAGAGNHVVLVHNFDQAQYVGETAEGGGDAVYARVGFDGRIPPQGDGVAPSPVFVNMDENGMDAPLDCPSSPTLEVTQGSIRIHCLQANSNAGPGGARDPDGGDLVVLEIWKLEEGPPPRRLVRGDSNSDGSINLTDGIVTLNGLFRGHTIACQDAADVDDSGSLNITDAVRTFQWLFRGGLAFAAPSPTQGNYLGSDCGQDTTPDFPADLGCETLAAKCSG